MDKETKKEFNKLVQVVEIGFKRIDEKFKESDRKIDEKFKESDKRIDERFKESDKRIDEKFKESDRKIDERFKESDRKIDSRFKVADKKSDRKIENLARMMQKGFDATAQKADVDKRFDQVDKRLNKIEATMVTKDYLSDKLADLRGDLVLITRKEDKKLQTLVGVLLKRKVISEEESKSILSLEPFPQLFV